MDKTNNVAIELRDISKSFGTIKANQHVNLSIYDGEILALLGENGSGKTTLMNMLAGIYYPDEGDIYVKGERAKFASPKDAFHYHIGMIHQHFKLIDVFTSLENIVLGLSSSVSKKEKISYFFANLFKKKADKAPKYKDHSNMAVARERVGEICAKYGFQIDLDKKVHEMSVSEKQTLEIVKAIYRGADLLILDEPTAVLTPVEVEKLFKVMRNMANDGKSIIIITHKLNEVMEISDRVAVLRKGEYVGDVETKRTNEQQLTEMMVGEKVELNIERDAPVESKVRLMVEGISCLNAEGHKVLHDVSFVAKGGEILGIAGISGSGQKEILESIAGLVKDSRGSIKYHNPKTDEIVDLRDKTPAQIRNLGVRLAFVPEDRLGMGLVGNMDLIDNMMLRSYRKGKGILLNRKKPRDLADKVVKELHVSTPSIHTSVRKLSGGNVQKVLVGREIASSPKVLMVAYPTRGLDINSSYMIYHLLNEQKKKGTAVIYVGEDLDVLIALSDRVLVIGDGEVRGIVDARKTDKNEIGLLMTKKEKKEEKKNA